MKLAESTKIHGIVCSPQELKQLKEFNRIKVVPGIRNELTSDDQKRTMSSKEAYENGADFIVVGRPITQADNIKETILNYI
jgi:orotidine-5'-phosphate decarboxylase